MSSSTLIIAEAGVNHNGCVTLALDLVDAAAQAGADIVKFQIFRASDIVTASAPCAEYQLSGGQSSQYELLSRLELSVEDYAIIMQRCEERKIQFLASAFDLNGLRILKKWDLPLVKIPSGELTNAIFLRELGAIAGRKLLSTGMATLGEIEEALLVLEAAGTPRSDITLLQCTTEYPAPYEEVNLLAMDTMERAFKLPVGFSDHTLGTEASIAAVALGAVVIEKHLTLDRLMEGPDHRASLEPAEFQTMVRSIRNIELALGNGIKKPTASEEKNKLVVRKSIVALRDIKSGDRFKIDNIGIRRPGTGLPISMWDKVLGRLATRDFAEGDLIEL